MSIDSSEKFRKCLAHIADLRERANAATDPSWKSHLRDLELHWMEITDSYKGLEETGRYLNGVRARRFLPRINRRLAPQLEALVRVAIEHADGTARAAFYVADPAGVELTHVIGMPEAYARHVNGFAIGTQSLACGLAVATRRPVVTPDVSAEPRWKPWLWLAEEFHYRACWSFPVENLFGQVLGSFAMYYESPRAATGRDLEIASVLARTAGTLISA